MRTATWTPDGGGDPLLLSDSPGGLYVLGDDLTGLIMPSFEHTTEVVAGVPGETLRHTRVTARLVTLPLLVMAPDRDTYRTRVKQLVRAFVPTGGRQGTLEVAEADGQRRTLHAIYIDGLEGDESSGGPHEWPLVIRLNALDPYWHSQEISIPLRVAAPVPFFPKLQLSSSQVQGEITIYNPGDEPAYPVWTIPGPGTDPTLISPDGRVLALSGSLLEGETLVINTIPGQEDITVDGVNWWSHITDDLDMWPIPVGLTTSNLSMTGATTESEIRVSFTPNFWSPL